MGEKRRGLFIHTELSGEDCGRRRFAQARARWPTLDWQPEPISVEAVGLLERQDPRVFRTIERAADGTAKEAARAPRYSAKGSEQQPGSPLLPSLFLYI